MGFPRGATGKISACQCRRHRFDTWIRKIPWRKKWQDTQVFLPGKFHGHKDIEIYKLFYHIKKMELPLKHSVFLSKQKTASNLIKTETLTQILATVTSSVFKAE